MRWHNHELINPIATTNDTIRTPLIANNPAPREHGDIDWTIAAIAVQEITLQQNPIAEGPTHHPIKKSPPKDLETQPERPHTVSNNSNRASNHQPTTSTEVARRRITSPILGTSPQSNQQEHYRTDYLHRKPRKQVRTKVSNINTAEYHPKASIIRNPRDISHKVNLKPNIKTSS